MRNADSGIWSKGNFGQLHSALVMIRPLRHRHRIMMLALTVTLPAGFAVGVVSRKEIPVSKVQAVGASASTRNPSTLWTRNDLWGKIAIPTRLLTVGSGAGQFAIELVPVDQVVRPDLLVYWIPGERKI